MNLGLIKTFTAGGSIPANGLVKFGSSDNVVVAAAAATDLIAGVCVQPGGASSGQSVDVQLSGIAEVKMGGTVARGAKVTSDGSAKGVAAAPAQGVNNQIIGIAMATTADGDIADVLIAHGVMQGA